MGSNEITLSPAATRVWNEFNALNVDQPCAQTACPAEAPARLDFETHFALLDKSDSEAVINKIGPDRLALLTIRLPHPQVKGTSTAVLSDSGASLLQAVVSDGDPLTFLPLVARWSELANRPEPAKTDQTNQTNQKTATRWAERHLARGREELLAALHETRPEELAFLHMAVGMTSADYGRPPPRQCGTYMMATPESTVPAYQWAQQFRAGKPVALNFNWMGKCIADSDSLVALAEKMEPAERGALSLAVARHGDQADAFLEWYGRQHEAELINVIQTRYERQDFGDKSVPDIWPVQKAFFSSWAKLSLEPSTTANPLDDRLTQQALGRELSSYLKEHPERSKDLLASMTKAAGARKMGMAAAFVEEAAVKAQIRQAVATHAPRELAQFDVALERYRLDGGPSLFSTNIASPWGLTLAQHDGHSRDVVVTKVSGLAQTLGLRVGDRVLEIGETELDGTESAYDAILQLKDNEPLNLGIRREASNGSVRSTVNLEVGLKPKL